MKKFTLPQVLAAAVSLMVVAAVAVGFTIAGSPALERARRFDDQRVSALQQIASALGTYAEQRQAVPATLDDLQTAASKGLGIYVPDMSDPETKQPYAYAATTTLAYHLCATFAATPRPTDPNAMGDLFKSGLGTPDFSKHPAGLYCWDVDLTERTAKYRAGLPLKALDGTVTPEPVPQVVPVPVAPAKNLAQ